MEEISNGELIFVASYVLVIVNGEEIEGIFLDTDIRDLNELTH